MTTDDIGHRLRKWRESQQPRKITQVQLAELIGIDQATLSQFEAGAYRLNEDRALKIEEVTSGAISAEDCVRDDRRRFVVALRAMAAVSPPEHFDDTYTPPDFADVPEEKTQVMHVTSESPT